MRHKNIKPVDIKRYRYLIGFGGGILLATLLVNCFCTKESSLITVFGRQYFENYLLVEVRGGEVFSYIVENRAGWLILWLLVCSTPGYRKGCMAICGIVGIFCGIMLSALTIQHGLVGLALFLFLLFPHGIFYCGCGWIFLKKRETGKLAVPKTLLIYFLMIACLLVGCTLEAFLSPVLISGLLK